MRGGTEGGKKEVEKMRRWAERKAHGAWGIGLKADVGSRPPPLRAVGSIYKPEAVGAIGA
jgi:hypothetical protein